mmetsp:Transcript_13251/g.32525  ORF Transcript_13251/g.32525 Transcript_13251/m.32525 type:complete len:261 (-) Transcript_13251:335-1117(-)
MAKSHQADLLRLDSLDESRNILLVPDLLEHLENGLVGSSMLWTVEGRGGTSNRGIDVDTGGGEVSHCGSGAVLLVVGVEDEEDLKRSDEFWVWAIVRIVELVHHVQETLRVPHALRGGIDKGAPNTVTVGAGGDRYDRAEDAVDLLVAELTVLVHSLSGFGGVGFGLEGGHCTHHAAHHSHGMGVVAEVGHHLLDVLVDIRVPHHVFSEGVELLLGGEVSEHEEIGDLEERGFLRELFDGNAPVPQHPFPPIDEGDSRRA